MLKVVKNNLLNRENDICRVFHGRGKCYPGFENINIDFYSPNLFCVVHDNLDDNAATELGNSLFDVLKSIDLDGDCNVIVQTRVGRVSTIVYKSCDSIDNFCSAEFGLKYNIDLNRGQNPGVFTDTQNVRKYLLNNAKACSVLNMFSYTCSNSVVSIEGGASKVVNIDMQSQSLNIGRKNHRENGHDLSGVSFLAHNIFKSFSKLRKLSPYDIIIADPPSFQHNSFDVEKDFKKIVSRVDEFSSDNAIFIAVINSPFLDTNWLIDMIESDTEFSFEKRLENAFGYCEIDNEKGVKALVFKKK